MTRTTLLICAIILGSVLGITFYGHYQDQFIMNSNSHYIAIFDKKSRTVNICDRSHCTLIIPRFPNAESSSTATPGEGSLMSRLLNAWHGEKGGNGRRLLGTFSPPQQMPGHHHMMGHPHMMQQMPQQGGNSQMAGTPPMNPQMMQQMAPQMMQPQMANVPPQGAPPPAGETGDTPADEASDETAPDEDNEEAAPV